MAYAPSSEASRKWDRDWVVWSVANRIHRECVERGIRIQRADGTIKDSDAARWREVVYAVADERCL